MSGAFPSITVAGLERRVVTLIAERDVDARQMYAQFLRLCGCEVDEASDGREALAKAITRRPDVIVAGTRLPGISAVDLCRLLRADPLTSATAIVLVSADGQHESSLVGTGADAILRTPCIPEQLASEIQRLLDRPPTVLAGHTPAHGPAAVARDRRVMLSHVHERGITSEPPVAPPRLVCPLCDKPLRYVNSHVGGVSARHPEQWDYFECDYGCGTFQYRHRTRKLRKIR